MAATQDNGNAISFLPTDVLKAGNTDPVKPKFDFYDPSQTTVNSVASSKPMIPTQPPPRVNAAPGIVELKFNEAAQTPLTAFSSTSEHSSMSANASETHASQDTLLDTRNTATTVNTSPVSAQDQTSGTISHETIVALEALTNAIKEQRSGPYVPTHTMSITQLSTVNNPDVLNKVAALDALTNAIKEQRASKRAQLDAIISKAATKGVMPGQSPQVNSPNMFDKVAALDALANAIKEQRTVSLEPTTVITTPAPKFVIPVLDPQVSIPKVLDKASALDALASTFTEHISPVDKVAKHTKVVDVIPDTSFNQTLTTEQVSNSTVFTDAPAINSTQIDIHSDTTIAPTIPSISILKQSSTINQDASINATFDTSSMANTQSITLPNTLAVTIDTVQSETTTTSNIVSSPVDNTTSLVEQNQKVLMTVVNYPTSNLTELMASTHEPANETTPDFAFNDTTADSYNSSAINSSFELYSNATTPFVQMLETQNTTENQTGPVDIASDAVAITSIGTEADLATTTSQNETTDQTVHSTTVHSTTTVRSIPVHRGGIAIQSFGELNT